MSLAKKGKTAWNKGLKRYWNSPSQFKNGDNAGDKHPNWKGGVSKIDKLVRRMKGYLDWRTKIFVRDNWTCQTCRDRGYVTVHHIKSFALILRENKIKNINDARNCEELWNTENGVTLCENCHSQTDNYRKRIKVL